MNKFFRYFMMVMAALAITTFLSCSPDDSGDGEGNPDDTENTETPNTPDDSDDSEELGEGDIIANNGVGEDGYIALNKSFGGIYFGQFWRKTNGEEWANYYLMLTNDAVGQTSAGNPAPMHQGGWVFFLDFWGVVADDHTNPVLPEGTYTLGEDRNWDRLEAGTTLATNNYEQVYNEENDTYQYRIADVFFTSGSVTVEHTESGYKIEGDFVTTDQESVKFRYEGELAFEDKSDDEEWSIGFEGDIEFEPVQGWTYRSSQKENCDKHIIYLFDTEEMTEDSLHPGVVGGKKMQLTIYTEIDGSIAGTYTAGEQKPNGFTLVEEKPGLYYPGCYWGSSALGSFVECATSEEDIEYSIIVSGSIEITENSEDGTYTIVVDGENDEGDKITCDWTGVLGGNPNSAE